MHIHTHTHTHTHTFNFTNLKCYGIIYFDLLLWISVNRLIECYTTIQLMNLNNLFVS